MSAPGAVVLAAGLGRRMQRESAAPLTAAQASLADAGIKSMIPDARGRPFLDHVLSALADGGIDDVCLVVGPQHEAISTWYATHPPRRIRVTCVVQPAPVGTANAVLMTEAWAGGRDTLVLNADNLYPAAAIRALVTLASPGFVAFDRETLVRDSNIDPDRIAAYAILELRPDDTLASIVEKPDAEQLARLAGSPWISMNLWRFAPSIYAACRDVRPSPRGELELPLAVALAIARGERLHAVHMRAGVLDLSNRGDVAALSERLGALAIDL